MLTNQQKATLKTFIQEDPVLSLKPNNSDGWFDIANELGKVFAPSFTVWKTDVTVDEIMRNGLDWTRVDNLSVGKARIWDWMTRLGNFNTARVNIRAGIDATWTGTASDLAVRATIYTHCKRDATIIEKLFATGVGTTAEPATMTFEGQISYQDVGEALNA